jgi:hypothetical protein
MKHFLKLLETVNQQGGVYSCNPMKDRKSEWTIDPMMSQEFVKLSKRCQPFVFSSVNATPMEVDLSAKAAVGTQRSLINLETIDAPFPIFSIEMIDGPITSPRPNDNPVYTDCLMVTENPHADSIFKYFVFALSRFERPGKEPKYFASVDITLDLKGNGDHEMTGEGMLVLDIEDRKYLPNSVMLEIVRKFLDRLDQEAAGAERVNERIKIRSAGQKEIVKIKRLIHVAPKKYKSDYATKTQKEIEWSHRWFSRGHWRKLPEGMLGKNREGDYVEVGRTWVTESIKGPEHKELVSKVRKV